MVERVFRGIWFVAKSQRVFMGLVGHSKMKTNTIKMRNRKLTVKRERFAGSIETTIKPSLILPDASDVFCFSQP